MKGLIGLGNVGRTLFIFNARIVTAFTYEIRDLKRKFINNFLLMANICMNTNKTNHR